MVTNASPSTDADDRRRLPRKKQTAPFESEIMFLISIFRKGHETYAKPFRVRNRINKVGGLKNSLNSIEQEKRRIEFRYIQI